MRNSLLSLYAEAAISRTDPRLHILEAKIYGPFYNQRSPLLLQLVRERKRASGKFIAPRDESVSREGKFADVYVLNCLVTQRSLPGCSRMRLEISLGVYTSIIVSRKARDLFLFLRAYCPAVF